jgi:hypothetical protein
MKLAPFIMSEAMDIAANFQHLVNMRYVEPNSKELYTVLSVGILPYRTQEKMIVTAMHENLIRKSDGMTVETMLDYFDSNPVLEYDVILSSYSKTG